MDLQDENKNIANVSTGPDLGLSKGMMGMKGNQQGGGVQPPVDHGHGQTDFQRQGKVSSDNPEPGTHHGVFPTPGQENDRQFGEHHYDIQGGRPKDLHKDQEQHDIDGMQHNQQFGQQQDPLRSHQDQRDQHHGIDSLQQGQHFGQHGSHSGQNDVDGVGKEYLGMGGPGTADPGV
jgi:hypothetical protein